MLIFSVWEKGVGEVCLFNSKQGEDEEDSQAEPSLTDHFSTAHFKFDFQEFCVSGLSVGF